MKTAFSEWMNEMDSLDETVYCLTNPATGQDIIAIGVPLDFSHDLVGLFCGFKQIVAPSIFAAHMLKTYKEAHFRNIADRFEGLVANMRVSNPNFYALPETDPDYREIQRELLNYRAEIKPKPYLDLRYDTRQKLWLYEAMIPENKLDNAYAFYE